MIYVYEHPASGLLLHVDYTPATATAAMILSDIRVADADYKPTGPSLLHFLHDTFTLDPSTHPALATRMLERIAQEVACNKNH